MKKAPTRAAIHAAELRVAQAKRNTRDSLGRAGVALRAALARPTTLALVAAAAGLLGFWIARRPKRVPTSSGEIGAAKTSSAAGVALAVILRYGLRRLPFVVGQLWAARQKRAARTGSDMSKWSDTGYTATGLRH